MAFLRYIISGTPREYELVGKTIIGRSPGCDLVLNASAVSRKHCSISPRGERFHLEDLRSSSGTLVNSAKVQTKVLQDGDVVTIGPFALAFSERQQQPSFERTDVASDENSHSGCSAELKVKAAISSPESIGISSVAPPKAGKSPLKRLDELWEIASQLCHLRTPEQLCSLTLRKILAHLGGDRARVLLWDAKAGEMKVVAAVGRTKAAERSAFRFPRRLQGLVLEDKRALLVQDASRDRRLEGSDSTVEQGIRSAIVAPLLDDNTCIGLIEADSTTYRDCYGDDALRFLCIVAQLLSSSILVCTRYFSLQAENLSLKMQLDQEREFILGNTPHFQALVERAKQVAQSEATVLLLGESGTGKNLLATAIHRWSPRSKALSSRL